MVILSNVDACLSKTSRTSGRHSLGILASRGKDTDSSPEGAIDVVGAITFKMRSTRVRLHIQGRAYLSFLLLAYLCKIEQR